MVYIWYSQDKNKLGKVCKKIIFDLLEQFWLSKMVKEIEKLDFE